MIPFQDVFGLKNLQLNFPQKNSFKRVLRLYVTITSSKKKLKNSDCQFFVKLLILGLFCPENLKKKDFSQQNHLIQF